MKRSIPRLLLFLIAAVGCFFAGFIVGKKDGKALVTVAAPVPEVAATPQVAPDEEEALDTDDEFSGPVVAPPAPVVAPEPPDPAELARRAQLSVVQLTDTEGRSIQAEILEATESYLKVRRQSDFFIVRVPIDMLSGDDKAFAKHLLAAKMHAPAEAPQRAGFSGQPEGGRMVYCDALWMRVHAEDCSHLILRDLKATMTLEQADKEGWRIGKTGQSGRAKCCLQDYQRKHPEKEITDDSIGVVQKMKSGKYKFHMAGCHRFKVSVNDQVMIRKEAKALPGYYMCTHCDERGPSVTYVDAAALAKMPTDGLVDTPYMNPIASLEEFMGRRFFFGYSGAYQRYRSTGDKRALEQLLDSARYYHNICVNYPPAARAKARDPEHLNYLFDMAGWSRITLQLARKYPDRVTQEAIAEAEAFLAAIVATLKSTCEGDEDLDPETGVPQNLANDFRSRAFNRAANGIGTLATISKALEDLQVIKATNAYQPTIDRYRKCAGEWIKHWREIGCLYTEADGKKYFYYPYAPRVLPRDENGLMTGGADDAGHYQYSVSGASLMFEAAPELGVDDEFMTAMANAVYHNSGTKNGSIQCPSADKIKPVSRHPWSPNPKVGFYVLEAFKDGLIDGQCRHMSRAKKSAHLGEESIRARMLYANYMKALRQDRSLIHLGERM